MADADLTIHSRRVITADGERDATVTVAGGRIVAVGPPDAAPRAERHVELGGLALLPGLVDTHVHVNEPGRTEWEGFATATRAAAAGGITTIVDMPLNSIPATVDVAALEAKRAAAAGAAQVRVAYWGGIVPGNARVLDALAAAGVRGFKCFLAPSGVAEFPHVSERDLREALPAIARLGLPLLVHAEDPAVLEAAAGALAEPPRHHASWVRSRPPDAEVDAIAMVIRLAAEFHARVHIVHLSAHEALPLLGDAHARGLPVTVETCPHYLTFAAEDVPDGATLFKCAPPIRERANRERLWAALGAGAIDLVASDHSPCPPAAKALDRGDFLAAWGGIASLELSLSAVWTGARERGHTLVDLARWMGAVPARLAGLSASRGSLVSGADADLVAFDPDVSWTVDPGRLRQRHPLTPYAGRTLFGRVERVFLGGTTLYESGAFTDMPHAAESGEVA